MYSIRTGLAAALLAAGMASIAVAADPPPPPPPAEGMHEGHGGPDGHFGPRHIYEKLGLSADQKARSDAIFAAKGPQLKNLHEQMHANMEKIHGLSPDDPKYGATISQLAQSGGSLMSQLITAEGDMRAQLFAILTPAQRTKLAAMEEKMRKRMREHAGDRDGGGRWGHPGNHHMPPPGSPPPGGGIPPADAPQE